MKKFHGEFIRSIVITVLMMVAMVFSSNTVAFATDGTTTGGLIDVSLRFVLIAIIIAAGVIIVVAISVLHATTMNRLEQEIHRADSNERKLSAANGQISKLVFEKESLEEALKNANQELRKVKSDYADKVRENFMQDQFIKRREGEVKIKAQTIGRLNGKIHDLESQLIAQDAKYEILKKRFEIAGELHEHLSEDIDERVRQEEEAFDQYVAAQFDEEYCETMEMEPAIENVVVLSMAIDEYYELSDQQRSFVFLDVERLKKVRSESLQLSYEDRASKLNSEIEDELAVNNHGTAERLPFLYAIRDKLGETCWEVTKLLDLEMLNKLSDYINEGEAEMYAHA